MAAPVGPKKVHRYTVEFKIQAVRLSLPRRAAAARSGCSPTTRPAARRRGPGTGTARAGGAPRCATTLLPWALPTPGTPAAGSAWHRTGAESGDPWTPRRDPPPAPSSTAPHRPGARRPRGDRPDAGVRSGPGPYPVAAASPLASAGASTSGRPIVVILRYNHRREADAVPNRRQQVNRLMGNRLNAIERSMTREVVPLFCAEMERGAAWVHCEEARLSFV